MHVGQGSNATRARFASKMPARGLYELHWAAGAACLFTSGECMPAHPLDFSHTIAFADAALGHIKRLKLSADPASYEVW